MIKPSQFYQALNSKGVTFFAGVPDSLLKNFCAYVSDFSSRKDHIIAANEGSAVGLGIGYHLATGKTPLIYLQNSGLGNIVNPLLSLADKDVYSIPMVILIGWRGQPGIKDEPQHVKQGRVMTDMLDAMEVPYAQIGTDLETAKNAIDKAVKYTSENHAPFALLVEKNAFDKHSFMLPKEQLELSREASIAAIAEEVPEDAVIVATTGMASRELFESRVKNNQSNSRDFLTVGGMGHASQIALGVALNQPDRPVVCIDGDGAAIMHMGGFTSIGQQAPDNLLHILINNGVHGSVGGQPTVAREIDFINIVKASLYKNAVSVESETKLRQGINSALKLNKLAFIEVNVRTGNRSDLGRPTATPQQNKESLMRFMDV